MQIIPIPAFKDNYIWLIHNGQAAIVVDPGDPQAVLNTLRENHLTLAHILITHHHQDHIGGVALLQTTFPDVKTWAPKQEQYDFEHQAVSEPDQLTLSFGIDKLSLQVIDLPGHTLGHIAFYAKQKAWLFCGDTLFGAGCGRLFEGTPKQMLASLHKLMDLPEHTQVFCAHEYTEHNLNFALSLAPDHPVLLNRLNETKALRMANQPTIPTTIGIEKQSNPFLRCNTTDLKSALDLIGADELAVFTAVRNSRNHF